MIEQPKKRSFWTRHKIKIIRVIVGQINVLGWFSAFWFWDEGNLLALILAIILVMITTGIEISTY